MRLGNVGVHQATPTVTRLTTADSGVYPTTCRNGHSRAIRDVAATPRRTLTRVETGLTHVDAAGAARMVDVSGKDITVRRAVAAGSVQTTAEVVALLRDDALPKGDALAVARIAGIMGAKRTPDLIPLCHPIALHGVEVTLELREDCVDITATVRTADRTGVEMEALTAVATAGLALIDMVKAVDPAASIETVRVLRKEGGKTGLWTRSGSETS
jgi:cyclic pyranopterin phosphate synthase